MRRSRILGPDLGWSCLLAVWLLASSVGLAEAGVGAWTGHGPDGGSIEALVIDPTDPNTLYVGLLNGGVFKSTTGGASWSGANVGLGPSVFVNALAINPANSATVYAASGRVFKSTDGGASWNPTGMSSSVTINALAVDPVTPATVYAGGDSGAFKTINSGMTWSPINTGLTSTIRVLAFDRTTAPTTLYAGTDGGVFKTTNGGANWSPASTGLTGLSVRALAIDPTNPMILYAGTSNGVFRSANGGGVWSPASTGLPASSFVYSLAIDRDIPTTVYAGTFGAGAFKSTNGGGSWSPVNTGLTHRVTHVVSDFATPATLYAGTDGGGVFKSANGGGAWTSASAGLAATTITALAIDPDIPTTLYAAAFEASEGAVFKSRTGGGSWSLIDSGLDPRIRVQALAVDPHVPTTVYAGAARILRDGGVFKSPSGGGGWVDVSTGLTSKDVRALAIARTLPTSTLYAGTYDGGVFKSTNGGGKWDPANTGLTNLDVYALAIDPTDPETLYAGTGGGVFRSENGGGLWSAASTGLTAFVNFLAIDPGTPDTLYAATSGGVFKSTDGGGRWDPVNSGLTNLEITSLAIHPLSPTTLYAAAGFVSGGIFKSTTGGASWSPVNTGLPGTAGTGVITVDALAIDPLTGNTVYAGTYGKGVFSLQASAGANIVVEPPALDFLPAAVGTASPVKTVTVRNDGTAPLTVGGITLGGAQPSQFKIAAKDLCSGTILESGDSCTVKIKFKPKNGGAQSATLLIPSNDPDASLVAVTLGGVGDGPEISVIPTGLGFGGVAAGTVSALRKITIRNDGSKNLTLGAISLGGANPGQFKQPPAKDLCSRRTLAPTQTCTVGIKFKPKTRGVQSATLSIASNDRTEALVSVLLGGTGL